MARRRSRSHLPIGMQNRLCQKKASSGLHPPTARWRTSVAEVCRWQMAMARASAASAGSGISLRLSRRVTMCCDLRLLRPAITHHGGLDGKRRILGNFQPGRGRGQHGHSTHLPQLERGLYVQCVEHIFDGDIVRPGVPE